MVKARHDEKLKEIHELANTPGRVKQHAEKWNKMSGSDLKVVATPSGPQAASVSAKAAAESKEDPGDTDSGSVSCQPLDPVRKRWMVAAALCEISELTALLKEDPKLASFKVICRNCVALSAPGAIVCMWI